MISRGSLEIKSYKKSISSLFQYNTAANKGFSAILALEYILVVPFAIQLQSQRDEYNRALEYSLSIISLLSKIPNLRDGLN